MAINWISVDDRMPPTGVTVLVWNGSASTAEWDPTCGGVWWAVADSDAVYVVFGVAVTLANVTHWAEVQGPEVAA